MARRPRSRGKKKPQGERRTKTVQHGSSVPPPPQQLHNLPTQLTSFIGREQEIAEVRRLLLGAHLLTLGGAAGCGKTRLAVQIARDVLPEFPDGVWMVDLAPLSNARFVPHAVATSLGVLERAGKVHLDSLADFLQPRELLLLLDNCEHVLPACAHLADAVLRKCPRLRILATSREPIGVPGEIRWSVPPLSLPEPRTLLSAEELMKYEAVRLFVDRAVAVDATFALTNRDVDAVAGLCRQLDGIPLAIEMAAAWVRVLTVTEILQRLSNRFQLLIGGSRMTVPRHQTLRMAMDWSYELLSAPEQTLLSRLSVFSGGWTLEAAEAACTGNGVEASAVLGLLTKLSDKSLVIADTRGDQTRYRLLETIRQYGRDRLRESGTAAEQQRRHRDWFLELAERAEPKLLAQEQVAWLSRLDTEHDNIRTALEWIKTEEGGADAWLRLAGALHEFWHMRGHHSEGREWLDGALCARGHVSEPARAKALFGAGILTRSYDLAKGEELLRECLAMYRRLEDQTGVAYSLHHLAHVATDYLDHDRAVSLYKESVAQFRDAGNKWGIGWSLHCLGMATLDHGDVAQARELLEESLAIVGKVGNAFTLGYLYYNLGIVAERQRDYVRATALLEQALSITREVGNKVHVPRLQCRLAKVSLHRGDAARAAELYRESLMLRQEIGDRRGLAETLEGIAELAGAQRDREQAARILGAADAIHQTTGRPRRLPLEQTDHDQRVRAIQASLGEADFATFWSEGRAMTLEQMIEYALASTNVLKPKEKKLPAPAAREKAGLLAPREREVAALIMEGRTNREIAARLSIAEGTVEAHVQHILNKLGFNSRAQIAGWVVARHLQSAAPGEG